MARKHYNSSEAQLLLGLFEVEVAGPCRTKEIIERLTPFVSQIHQKTLTVTALARHRRHGKTPIAIQDRKGSWIIYPAIKQGRSNLWNLSFRPNNGTEKVS